MERKLVRQGRNALTMTLPAPWIKQHNLSAGDVVHLTPLNEELTVKVSRKPTNLSITLDLRGMSGSELRHKVLREYLRGADEIIVLHDAPKARTWLESYYLDMVMSQYTPSRLVLTNIIDTPHDTLDTMVRRCSFMLIQQAQVLCEAARGNATRSDVNREEQLLDRHVFYCMRYLHRHHDIIHEYPTFLLLTTMEQAGDLLTEMAKWIEGHNDLADLVHKHLEEYSTLYFKNDTQGLITSLKRFRSSCEGGGFVHGLAYALAEHLYNNVVYLMR